MQIMTQKSTTMKFAILAAFISTSLTGTAYAGEKPPQDKGTQSGSFSTADNNQDEMLTREEFKVFVALKSETGDEDYAIIYSDGTEDLHFSGKDIDGDGLLTKDELAFTVIFNHESKPNKTIENTSSYGSGESEKVEVTAPKPDDGSPKDDTSKVDPATGG